VKRLEAIAEAARETLDLVLRSLLALGDTNTRLQVQLDALQERMTLLLVQGEELQTDIFELHRRLLDIQEDSLSASAVGGPARLSLNAGDRRGDSLRTDSLRVDSLRTDSLRTDSLRADDTRADSLHKESFLAEGLPADPLLSPVKERKTDATRSQAQRDVTPQAAANTAEDSRRRLSSGFGLFFN